MDQQEPKCYRNTTNVIVGAVRILPGQPPKGIAVRAGETVWLDPDERKATANAPKSNAHNPFANGAFELVTEVRDSDVRAEDVPEPDRQPAQNGDPAPPAPPAEDEAATAAAKAAEAARVASETADAAARASSGSSSGQAASGSAAPSGAAAPAASGAATSSPGPASAASGR